MEHWKQLRQAGLVPLELGPPPRALREDPPVERPGQPLEFPETDTGDVSERLLWIREELGELRQADIQLLDQLCSLALEIGVLREELEEQSTEEDEEDEQPQRKQEEEDLEASCPATRLPDFEITI